MKVAICSLFRNSSAYLDRYLDQVLALHKALHKNRHELTLCWGEGDSTDDTRMKLEAGYRALAIQGVGEGVIVDVTHHGPEYGSVVNVERFKQLAYAANRIWQAIPENTKVVVFVEGDLTWEASAIMGLIKRLKDYQAISPMVLLRRNSYPPTTWYDTWGGRKGGKRFTQQPPYFQGYNPDKPVQIDSMGSCMAIRGDLARKLVWPEEDVFVGLCRNIYALGASVWLDPTIQIYHD